jgi:hypothetical protein
VKATLNNIPENRRGESSQDLEDANGTGTPKKKWFEPDDEVLPPPVPLKKRRQVP